MKKAINLYCINGDTKEKLDTIKKVGFDGVFLGVYDKKETMTLEEQVAYCKKIGLGISMIHCSYVEPKLNGLWIEGSEDGEFTENDLLNQVERIKNFGVKDFVIHSNGGFDVQNTKAGLIRLQKILKACEKNNLNLCVENLYTASQVEYIFDNLKSKNLTFCYDCGHDNFLTPGSKLLEKYGYLLTTTHLHDNHGKADEHMTLGMGSINQEELAKRLAKCNFEYLSAEVREPDPNQTLTEALEKNLKALNKLDKLIEKHKQVNQESSK